MDLRSVPDIIRALRSFSRRDSTALSSRDKSGLTDVPGDCVNLYLWERIDCTSHAVVRRTSIDRVRLSSYLPNLKQSRVTQTSRIALFANRAIRDV